MVFCVCCDAKSGKIIRYMPLLLPKLIENYLYCNLKIISINRSMIHIIYILEPNTEANMDPLLFLPLNLQEEQLEEFQAEDDTTPLTPQLLEDDEQDSEIVAAIRQSEVDQRCRMCADKHENMKQIFSTEAMELSLPFKMEKYLYITVSEEDRLPLQVCVSCEAKLEMSVALAESCADAQTFLNNLLAPPNTEEPTQGHDSDFDADRSSSSESSILEQPDSPVVASSVAVSPPASPEMLADNFSDNSEDAFPELLENLPTTSDPIEEQQIEELINIGIVPVTKPNAFVCEECSVTCIDKDDLENHYDNEHVFFLCTEGCDLIFNSSTELNKHIKQAHTPKVNLLNELIQNKFKKIVHNVCNDNEIIKLANERTEELKKSHKKKLVGKEISELKCPICDKVYKKKCHLKYHILRHGGLRKEKCPVCYKWLNVDTLRSHKQTHNAKEFVCDVCQRQFSCKRYIDTHIRKVHMKEWFYQCTMCNKKHKNEASIKKHVKTHKKVALTTESKFYIKKSNFHCKICNRYSANEFHFKDHILKHKRAKNGNTHIDQPNFQCEMCAKMYKTKIGLNLHIQAHQGEKPHQCQYCPKRFLHKQALQTHEMIHEGNLAFKCHLCPKSYVTALILRNHIRRIHLDLRPFECKFCDKTFHTANNLRVHTRTHTGERPFICKFCNRQFTQKHEMQRHEATHSNSYVYNCKNCKFGSNRLKILTEHICSESKKE